MSRCPYVNPDHDNGQCGQVDDHGGSHVLYDPHHPKRRILTGTTPWVHPDVAPPARHKS